MHEFREAHPAWIAGRGDVWNQMAGFHAAWSMDDPSVNTVLRITGADSYRIWVNGKHAGYGAARTAHGYARVDEWPLNRWLRDGENHVAIEVHCHGIDSYVFAMQPAFLQAELLSGDAVVAATPAGFTACVLSERVQKVERFSKQRPFAEAYRLTPDCNDWRVGKGGRDHAACEQVPGPRLLPRHVLLPRFDCVSPVAVIACGNVIPIDDPPEVPRSAARDAVGKRVRGYPVDELDIDMSAELIRLDFVEQDVESEELARTIPASGHALYDFGTVQGGFVGLCIHCKRATRVWLVFDEIRGRDFALGVGAILLDLEPGEHEFESIAPYSFRFLRVAAMDSDVKVESVHVREYAHPATDAATYSGDDRVIGDIFVAARQTFRTNSIDLFTDCPSRERGGYPCDAWFTAQAERVLTGESRVERNFLENYFLPTEFPGLPEGMVPHCYPSDALGGRAYIPNWAIWLQLQLVDYCERTADADMRDLASPRVQALVDWFEPHLNDQGLLEDLPGWVFVEWSPANDLVDGVNHPTNMLYARCLEGLSRLYGRPEWAATAKQMKASVLAESWDGRWFADQSLRVDGRLERNPTRTETCQYHALWTETATREQTGDLWTRLRDGWGPRRGVRMIAGKGMTGWRRVYDEGVAPRPDDADLAPAGLLYGILLRFDLLRRYGERERLLDEVRAVFGPQAELTGTLWEHATPFSSCNHGFASCACDYVFAPG